MDWTLPMKPDIVWVGAGPRGWTFPDCFDAARDAGAVGAVLSGMWYDYDRQPEGAANWIIDRLDELEARGMYGVLRIHCVPPRAPVPYVYKTIPDPIELLGRKGGKFRFAPGSAQAILPCVWDPWFARVYRLFKAGVFACVAGHPALRCVDLDQLKFGELVSGGWGSVLSEWGFMTGDWLPLVRETYGMMRDALGPATEIEILWGTVKLGSEWNPVGNCETGGSWDNPTTREVMAFARDKGLSVSHQGVRDAPRMQQPMGEGVDQPPYWLEQAELVNLEMEHDKWGLGDPNKPVGLRNPYSVEVAKAAIERIRGYYRLGPDKTIGMLRVYRGSGFGQLRAFAEAMKSAEI